MSKLINHLANIHLSSISLIVTLVAFSPSVWAAQQCKPSSLTASTPDNAFIQNNDGTVTHKATGLMWKVCSQGQSFDPSNNGCTGSASLHNWQAALDQAQAESFASYNDWRLPNIKELASIVELSCVIPAINLSIYPNTPSSSAIYWSSTPVNNNNSKAWVVDFFSGLFNPTHEKNTDYYIRLVRSR